MKHLLDGVARIALVVLILTGWLWAADQSLSSGVNLSVIVGGVLLVLPVVWLGRILLDKKPTPSRAAWITTVVHYTVVILLGGAVIRALKTHRDWSGWALPVPAEIGLLLVILTGGAALLSVINLALKGLGAPFAVALSRKLAVDWLYAWTRNPMVLASLALGLSLGVWFQSILFVLWVLILVAPALLVIVKVFEERELEIRFGASYLDYKYRTPLLFPRRPRG
jgi:protein-S-isoprenylcysteine O-methyltransferase Ste14